MKRIHYLQFSYSVAIASSLLICFVYLEYVHFQQLYPNTKVKASKSFNICDSRNNFSNSFDLLLMIPSAANETEARQAIRNSYASVSRNNTANVRHVFLFGKTNDGQSHDQIRKEKEIYHDIVILDMMDSYDNLTLKVILGLKWVSTSCRNAKYVMKLDTDTWLNIRELLTMLARPRFSLYNRVGGFVHRGAIPDRNPKAKWYTSKSEYAEKVFPDYCAGPGYIMPINVARDIAEVSKTIKFIRMEDVYIGICLRTLKYSVKQLYDYSFSNITDLCKLKTHVLVHRISPKDMVTAWKLTCKTKAKVNGVHNKKPEK